MSPDKAHTALIVLTGSTVLIFVMVATFGAMVPMPSSLQADRWMYLFKSLIATLVLEAVGLILFAAL